MFEVRFHQMDNHFDALQTDKELIEQLREQTKIAHAQAHVLPL